MPAKNPRTNLTLPVDLDAVITELAELQGTSKSKIITSMLLEIQPYLEMVRDALKTAHANQDDAKKVAKDFAHSMLAEGAVILGDMGKGVKDL